jgi:DNA helicase II / ATP-dependent DNA helicase PcrA
VLREGGAFGTADEVVTPRTTRVDGPVPKVVSHPTDDGEAAWVAQRAKLSRTPGRRWSSIAVLTRTNAQLARVQTAMDAARVPSTIAGADLGPASDLRADGGRQGQDRDEEDLVAWEDPADRDRVVLTTFHRAKGLQWPTVIVLGLGAGLMPIASAQTVAAIDEERRLLYVALTRSEEELWCSWFERSADDARQGGPPRGPSPWLAPIERTIALLDKEAAPTAAAEVSARVAELRARLAEAAESTESGP